MRRKVWKWFKWSCVVVTMIGLFSFLSVYYYLETSIDRMMSPAKQKEVFGQLDKIEELPTVFYTTMEKYYPDYMKQTVWASLWAPFTKHKHQPCPCRGLRMYKGFWWDNDIKFARYVMALELEERYGNKKCFAILFQYSSFGHNTRGVKEATKLYFNKTIEELTEREVVTLYLITISPYRFNPISNKENLDKTLNRIMKNNP